MRATYLTAGAIALLIGLWLLSGQFGSNGDVQHPTLAEQKAAAQAQRQDDIPTRVRARVSNASPQVRHVVLRGKTVNKRTVQVKAETAGRVVDRPVERGSRVAAGDVLCQISMEDRYASLVEAREALAQARIEYDGSLKLKERGFQSDTAIAQAKARLAAAEADLKRREIDIERTYVRAPFAGVIEQVHQEVGDYVTPGAACVTVVDLDPMLLVGRVAERDVHLLEVGGTATGMLNDGRTVEGPVTFVGQQSDPATRTYAVEVQVPNPAYELRSGVTTEIRLPVDQVSAHKISPALFTLDDNGALGVRTINSDNRVEFHEISIVREAADGVWVAGLPEVVTLITIGQELVVPGETVRADYEPARELPAAAPQAPPGPEPNGAAGDEASAPVSRTSSGRTPASVKLAAARP